MPEKTMGVLFYLSHGECVDERTLIDRFGKEPVEFLLKAKAIERQWNDDPLFPSYKYWITENGRTLLSSDNHF